VLLIVAALGVGIWAYLGGPAESASANWSPDPSLLGQLDDEAMVGSYRMRPPRGFVRLSPPQGIAAGAEVYSWGSEPRPDGTRTVLTILLINAPSPDAIPPVGDIHRRGTDRIGQRKVNFQLGPLEQGLANGITWMRTRWKGSDSTIGELAGFCYTAVHGQTAVQITGQSMAREADGPLRLAEAAVLTFRK
jgi:hypothetical protein